MDDTQRRKPNEQKMSTLKRHLGRFSIWDNQVSSRSSTLLLMFKTFYVCHAFLMFRNFKCLLLMTTLTKIPHATNLRGFWFLKLVAQLCLYKNYAIFFSFFFWKWPTLIYRGQEMTKRMNTEGITMVSSMGRFRKRTTWRQDARECILSPCVLFYYTIVVVHYGFQEVEKKKDFKEGKKLLPLNGNCLENLSIVRNVNTFDDTTKDKLKKKMCYWNRKMSCVCGFLSPLLPLAYQCRKRRFFL